ncbi:MAG: SurA N-terminal domain-containing protein [Eikenella sp.]|nr:SurA N-terminal domain-containing protein [Eikenella sp.]
MFEIVEKHRTAAQVLLGLIAVTLVGFGVGTLAAPGSDYIAKVGDVKINTFQINELARAARANGNPVDEQAIYQALVQQAYLEAGAREAKVGEPSLEHIQQELMKDPQFQIDSQFSKAAFENYLRQRGLNEDQFIEEMRNQYRRQTMFSLLAGGHIVSDVQARRLLAVLDAERSLRSVAFEAKAFADKVQADDAQLQKYFDARKADYALPLAVKLEYVELSIEELAKQQSVSAEELQQAYQNMAPPAGQEKPDFETAKADLEADLRNRKASQSLITEREKLSQLAFEHPDSLQTVAEQMKLPLQKHETWLSRPEAEASRLPAPVLAAMFGDDVVVRRHNSDVLDMGNGVLRVLRASDVSQAREQTFEEAKAAVRKDYIAAESLKLAQAAAAEALGRADNGNQAGLAWSAVEKIGSLQLQQNLGMENFSAILKARPQTGKPAYAVVNLPEASLLLEVQAVELPADSESKLAHMRELAGQRTAESFYALYMQHLEKRFPLQSGAQKLNSEAAH